MLRLNRQSPNFMAFFPATATFPSMLGELYSAAFTAPAFNWICSPAVTELETIVLDWMAKLFNLPPAYHSSGHGGGVIQGSASEAIVTVMVAARDKYLRETTAGLEGLELEDKIAYKRSRLVALGSEAAHSSTHKAALIAGVRFRTVPVTKKDNFAMTGAGLEKVLKECKEQGLEPFYLTATLGTTNTCAVDDFQSIADTLAIHAPPHTPGEIWVHVDAAYAGAALICPEHHHLTKPLEHFHSYNMNMHKWLMVNFDASLLYITKRKDLVDALSVTPAYLRNEHTDSGLVTDYRDWQIPLGRRFRSIKIWFVLRTYGVKALQALIRKHISLGEHFASLLKSRQDLFEIVTDAHFALTVFDIVSKNKGNVEEQDKLTKDVYELVNKRGEVYITSTVVGGRYAIRVVSANERTEEKYINKVFEILVEAAEEVRDGKARTRGGVEKVIVDGKGEGVGEVEVLKSDVKA
jgi:aromatic-L-amino-acid decarboxylase